MQSSVLTYIRSKELIVNKGVIRFIGIMFFLLCTVFGAFVYIPLPFTPVPITMQTFFVILCAAFLRKNDAMFTQGSYLGLGALGLPLFSGAGGGLARLFGPTGGYIVGFVVAAFGVSSLLTVLQKREELTFLRIAAAMSMGIVIIYLCGGLWLAYYVRISFSQAFMLGMIPFIPGDIVKIVLAAFIYTKTHKRARLIFYDE